MLAFSIAFAFNLKSEPLAAFTTEGVWYFLNETGEQMCDPMVLDGVGSYSENFLYVKKRTKDTSYFCYLDRKGNERFKINSTLPFNFNSGVASTVKFLDEKGEARLFGFVNNKGKVLYENVLHDALDFSDSLAYINTGKERGYIGIDGQFKIRLDTSLIGYKFAEGKAAVADKEYRFGFIDKTGKLVIPYKYDETGEFSEGLCKVYYKGYFGFINHQGEFVIENKFDEAKPFSESFAFVAKYDSIYQPHWGFINKDGRLIEEYIYSRVNDFSEGFAAVQKNGKWGFINYAGETKIDFIYDVADSFKRGLAFVVDKTNGKAGFINQEGKFVISLNKFDILVELRSNNRYYSFNNK